MTAVYLAAPYAARDLVRNFAADLDGMLVEVTSSWLKEDHEITAGTLGAAKDLSDDQVAKHARDDLKDIGDSDLLVLITESIAGVPGTTGGRHVETGFALGFGLPVLVVGPAENVFHRLGESEGVYLAKDWPDALSRIATLETGAPLAEAFGAKR